MSLPDAKKSISENPAKDSVASPTDRKELEKDVDRKLRFYGVIQAFRNGRMPDNAQVDEILVYLQHHSLVDESKLSPEGKKLADDLRSIGETARQLVKEKNGDEVLQQFFYHTSGAQLHPKPVDAPISEQEARKDGQEALQHLRTLLQLLLTNSETRKLLSDFKLIGLDLFAETATSIAERTRPAPEALAKVDDPAPPQGWDGSPSQVPGATTETNGTTPATAAVANDKTPAAPASPAEAVKEDKEPNGAAAATAGAEKKSFISRIQGLTGRVPEKHKTRAKEELTSAKKYLKDEFPQERRDQFIYRLKKVVVECQSHPSYQSSLSWFLSQLENYFAHTRQFANSSATQTSSFFSDPLLNQATSELRIILERFANGKSMQGMISAAQKLSDDAANDEELKAWWGKVDTFVRKSLMEPGFILTPQFESQARKLRDESRKFFDVKYKGHKDALIDAVQAWFGAWGKDPLNHRFTDDWSKLLKDLLFDESGQLTFKPQLWSDIRQVVLPSVIEKVGYIPIPRIEYTDKDLDLVIENLTLQGRNLFPKILEFTAQNYLKVSPYTEIKDEHHHTLTISLSQIQADMKDVAFYYYKKGGFGRIRDSGLADVFLGGKGISVKVKISSTTKEREGGVRLYKVKDVSVKVDTLKFAIRDSKHNLLYKTLRPLATGLIKKQIAKVIADGIRTGLEYIDGQLVQVRDRMHAAEASEDGSRTQVLKDMLHHKSTSDDASSKASTKAKRGSSFRIAPTRDSMLIPEHIHEKGWVKRQAEKDEKATEGEGWRSKAFSIITASA
ncbi:hypothetical protein BD410DRAFT_793854 [Rickenella mellea]|uniref:Uncharacterized protein n=1 Tax=Rickenella mellea TaxID=50990 RepID=A0A4Y7PSI0_9AGAM|nr:hypothetical protein BD410DRAFT_793854 [Rickenella mellea]